MKTRGMTVMLALLLAVGATTAVFLYVDGVRKQAKPSASTVAVIVSKENIPAGSALDDLISNGDFTTVTIPPGAVVEGAITDLNQLKGKTTSAAVLAGEQIPAARLQGSTAHTGGILGIRDGFEAVTVPFDTAQGGGGYIAPGDHITIYAAFSDVSLIRGNLARFLAGRGAADNSKQSIGSYTVTLVPDVRVLQVVGQTPGSTNTGNNSPGSGSVRLTLELTPQDSERVIYAQAGGGIWVALLPPGQQGVNVPPTSIGQLLLPAGASPS